MEQGNFTKYSFYRDWLQDDLMKINTEDDSYPVWVPFSVKVTLQEDGNLKIEEFADDDPIPDNPGRLSLSFVTEIGLLAK